jgi:hypothetical protein
MEFLFKILLVVGLSIGSSVLAESLALRYVYKTEGFHEAERRVGSVTKLGRPPFPLPPPHTHYYKSCHGSHT